MQLAGTATDLVQIGGQIGAAAVPAITNAAGMSVATAAWAVPVIGGAIAGVTYAITAFLNRKGPKQKIASTHVADELFELLEKNEQAYINGPRTPESQAVALDNFDRLLAWLKSPEGCGNAQLGDAGRRCIAERAEPGGKYSMWPYRERILANPPLATAEQLSNATGAAVDQLKALMPPLGIEGNALAIAGLALVVFAILGGGK